MERFTVLLQILTVVIVVWLVLTALLLLIPCKYRDKNRGEWVFDVDSFVIRHCYRGNALVNNFDKEIPGNFCQLFWGISWGIVIMPIVFIGMVAIFFVMAPIVWTIAVVVSQFSYLFFGFLFGYIIREPKKYFQKLFHLSVCCYTGGYSDYILRTALSKPNFYPHKHWSSSKRMNFSPIEIIGIVGVSLGVGSLIYNFLGSYNININLLFWETTVLIIRLTPLFIWLIAPVKTCQLIADLFQAIKGIYCPRLKFE